MEGGHTQGEEAIHNPFYKHFKSIFKTDKKIRLGMRT